MVVTLESRNPKDWHIVFVWPGHIVMMATAIVPWREGKWSQYWDFQNLYLEKETKDVKTSS